MLEDWAWGHIAHSEGYLKLFSLGWMALGGIVAALFQRVQVRLGRAAYFALSAMVVLGIAVFQAIWLWGGVAMQGGWLFWLVALDASLSFVAGYGLVVLGQARSRDALGHGRAGIVSMVPIANLWLLFMPGQEPWKATFVGTALRGGLGVVAGVGFLVLSRLVEAHVYPEIEAGVIAVGDDPALADRFLELEFARFTPEELLQDIARQTEVPQMYDGGLGLMKVMVEGRVLTYVYQFLEPGGQIEAALIEDTRQSFCLDPVFVRLLDGGAQVDFVYLGPTFDGEFVTLDRFSTTAAHCRV